MADKRVIEQTASSEIYNDDWFLKDSVLQGTTKISAGNLKELLTGDVNDRVDKLLRNIIGPTYEWSASKTYKAGAIVYYEDSLYYCIVDTATVGTFVPSEWRYVDLYENLTGKIQSVIKMLAPYMQFSDVSSIMPYSKGDIVRYQPSGTYKEKFYVAKEDLPEGVESYDANDWDEYDTIGELIAGLIADISDSLTADGISYDNTTSGLEADDVQEAIDEVVTAVESVETALETKAEVDGFYDELYAGNLLSENTESDNAPYLYRQSPSGKSCVDLSLVGGTVAWNQLVQNGNFASADKWTASSATFSVQDGIATVTRTTSSGGIISDNIPFANGHKYIVSAIVKNGSSESLTATVRVNGKDIPIADNTNWQTVQGVISGDASSVQYVYFRIASASASTTLLIDSVMLIDLTQMLGSAIADNVYTLEQSTAGSGIAWLKSYGFFTKDYYAYQSGKLESVNVSAKKVVGFNQLNENLFVADKWLYATNGNIQDVSGRYATVEYIPCMPSTRYYFVAIKDGTPVTATYELILCWYDENKTFISCENANISTRTQLSPSNAHYFRIGKLTGQNVNVNISDTAKNGTYEPYNSKTYPLDSSLTLRGILKKDANNNLYYDGDTYESDGSVKRKRTQLVLDGLKSYGSIQADTNTVRAYIQINDMMPNNTTTINIVSANPTYAPDYLYSSTNDVEGVCENKNATTNGIWFRIAKSKLSSYDLTGIRAYLSNNPITVEYELKTPTTESATPFTNPQFVGSTEEFVDAQTSASTPTRDVEIPVGQDSKYHTDLKAKLEELAKIPDVPSTNGTYTLKATRSASGVEYNWVSG